MKPNCYLHALSSYVPAEVLTNDDLSKLVETNDEWITTRTGIKRRHRLPQEENASDLGTHAARKALEDAGLDAAKLTHILTATCTPDHLSPSLSCIIGGNIGAGPAMSFDFGSACSGFLYGLHLATASFFQGIGRPVPSLAIPLARQGVFLIPLAILLSGRFGLDGALLAAPISDVLTFLLSLLLVRREFAVWRQRDWIET